MPRRKTPQARSAPAPPGVDPATKVPRYFSDEARALRWPAAVPVLLAADILGDGDRPGGGRRPIWEWLVASFPGSSDPDSDACQVEAVVHNELFRAQVEVLGARCSTSLFDFSRRSSPAEVAALWNAVMASLGYTPDDREGTK